MAVIITLVLLFVGILFLVLLHVCFSEWFSRREGTDSMVERNTNGGRSISIIDLDKLPCYDYVAKDNTSSPVDCAVCLENLTTGDKCRLLPICKHSFHAQCVDTWLLKSPICPICRSRAGSHGGNNGYFTEPNSLSRDSQSDTGSQPNNNMLRESLESGSSRNAGIEVRENPTLGSTISGHRQVESQEH